MVFDLCQKIEIRFQVLVHDQSPLSYQIVRFDLLNSGENSRSFAIVLSDTVQVRIVQFD